MFIGGILFVFIHQAISIESTEMEAVETLKPPGKTTPAKPVSPVSSGGQGSPTSSTNPASLATPAGVAGVSSPADILKAQAEVKKVEIELIKAKDAGKQFYFDYSYKILLLVAVMALLIWLFPKIQEISIPFGVGTVTVRKAPKETISGAAEPLIPSTLTAQAADMLKKTLEPGPASNRIVEKLGETETYQAAGVLKDAIYICHRSRRISRGEYYRVCIYLDADEPSILDKVEKVIYMLHPTYVQPEITKSDPRSQFRLDITAWGEFMLYAQVYFKGADKAVQLKRYLNL